MKDGEKMSKECQGLPGHQNTCLMPSWSHQLLPDSRQVISKFSHLSEPVPALGNTQNQSGAEGRIISWNLAAWQSLAFLGVRFAYVNLLGSNRFW